jgi:hypothetical protein
MPSFFAKSHSLGVASVLTTPREFALLRKTCRARPTDTTLTGPWYFRDTLLAKKTKLIQPAKDRHLHRPDAILILEELSMAESQPYILLERHF